MYFNLLLFSHSSKVKPQVLWPSHQIGLRHAIKGKAAIKFDICHYIIKCAVWHMIYIVKETLTWSYSVSWSYLRTLPVLSYLSLSFSFPRRLMWPWHFLTHFWKCLAFAPNWLMTVWAPLPAAPEKGTFNILYYKMRNYRHVLLYGEDKMIHIIYRISYGYVYRSGFCKSVTISLLWCLIKTL